MNMVSRLKNSMTKILTPYRFGFVRGHDYLSEEQVDNVLWHVSSCDSTVTAGYEEMFGAILGDKKGCVSFASGRMGFYAVMKVLNIGPGDEVILPAFTCSVMPNAVIRSGAKPVFADIDASTFGSKAELISAKITPVTRLIVAQHSFGIPCDIRAIVELGKEKGIFVLEDSAIAFDSEINNSKVGTLADAAIFSTDHTKPLNTIIGGLVFSRNTELIEKIRDIWNDCAELETVHKQRLLNTFLFERKYMNPARFPRAGLFRRLCSLKNFLAGQGCDPGFLTGDYTAHATADYPYPARMPSFLCQLGIYELERWNSEKRRRIGILDKYISIMRESGAPGLVPLIYNSPDRKIVPLRFVFEVNNAAQFMGKTSKYLDAEATWFRGPIICAGTKLSDLGYNGDAPGAEKICSRIINWPCVIGEAWEKTILKLFRSFIVRVGENK